MSPLPQPSSDAATLLQRALRRPLLTAAGLVGLLLLLTLALFSPRYETLDDAIVNLIVAGQMFADTPDEHLLFSNVLVGLALKGLYQAAPGVPWYGLYLIAVVTLSLLGLCYAFLRANPTALQLLLAAGFLLAVGLPCLVWLQFTRAAFLAALAGLSLLLAVASGRAGVGARVGGVLLLVLGSLVRFDGCLLAGSVLAPAVAAGFLTATRPRVRWLLAACLAGPLALGWGLGRLNHWYYERDQDWRGFYEFNALSAQFTDYLRVEYNEHTKPALDAVGWSATDLAMLYQFSFADPERFSADKLRAVLTAAGTGNRVMRWRSLEQLKKQLQSDASLPALLGVGVAALVLMGGGWRARVVPLLCFLGAAGVALVLFLFFHLPAQVYFPAFSAGVAVTLLRSTRPLTRGDLWPGTLAGATRRASLVLAAAMVLWSFNQALEADNRVRAHQMKARQMMTALAPRSDQLLVLWADAFPYQNVILPLEAPSVPRDCKAVALLWITRTPLTRRRLREFGITDLYRGLYTHREVYLLSNPLGNRLLADYLWQHYGIRLGTRVVYAHPALGGNRFYALIDRARLLGRPTAKSPSIPESQRLEFPVMPGDRPQFTSCSKGAPMCRQKLCGLVLASVTLLSGCRNRPDSLDEVLNDRINLVNQMAEVLEDVTDEESAEEARAELELLLKKQADINKRAKKLQAAGPPSKETMKRLAKREREELMVSLMRLEKAREKALKDPEVARLLEKLPLPRPPAAIAQPED